jgi:hypothetical protein
MIVFRHPRQAATREPQLAESSISGCEVCIFLGRTLKAPQVRRVDRVSKSKLAHFIQITHRDEVEAPTTDWLHEAYESSDAPATTERTKRESKPTRRVSRHDTYSPVAEPMQRVTIPTALDG